jgi:hypothetical protein
MKTASYRRKYSNYSKIIVAIYYNYLTASYCLLYKFLNSSNYSSSPRDTG